MSRTAKVMALVTVLVSSAACGGGSDKIDPTAHATLPFELQVAQESLRLFRGDRTNLIVEVSAVDEADWPVTITVEPLPHGVSAIPLHLQAASMSGDLVLVVHESVSLGSHQVDVIARGGVHEVRRTMRLEVAHRGAPDPFWGRSSAAMVSVRDSEHLTNLAVDETGRLYASLQDRGGGLRVLRLGSDGRPDDRFGTAGFASLDDFEPGALVAQADGLLLAGSTRAGAVVVRLDDQGTADPAFGESGIATLDATGTAVAIRADEGRINVAGGDQTLFVASLDSNGSVLALNTRERTNDRSLTGAIAADAVYLTWDAYNESSGRYESSLIKSDLEGTADPSFAVDGVAELGGTQLLADARGGVVACGFMGSQIPNPALMRVKPDGSRDSIWGTPRPSLSTGAGGCWSVVQAGADLVTAAGASNLEESVLELFLISGDGRIDRAFGEAGALRFRLGPFASTAVAADQAGLFVGWSEDGTLKLRRFLL